VSTNTEGDECGVCLENLVASKHGYFQDLEQEIEFLHVKRTTGVPIHEAIKRKAWTLADDTTLCGISSRCLLWCVCMKWRDGFFLWRRTLLCQKLPASRLRGEACCFHLRVIGLRTVNKYVLSQIGNADEMPVYSDVLLNYIASDHGAKSVAGKTLGNERM
jgi:hypothetical protein